MLEEGQRTCRLTLCEYNNKNEDNSLNILNDKNKSSVYLVFSYLYMCVLLIAYQPSWVI